MQERDELRALKRELKMSRERKVKRKICVWKRKEKRKREKEEKERRTGKKDLNRDESSEK
jgi:hypothetical protein